MWIVGPVTRDTHILWYDGDFMNRAAHLSYSVNVFNVITKPQSRLESIMHIVYMCNVLLTTVGAITIGPLTVFAVTHG